MFKRVSTVFDFIGLLFNVEKPGLKLQRQGRNEFLNVKNERATSTSGAMLYQMELRYKVT